MPAGARPLRPDRGVPLPALSRTQPALDLAEAPAPPPPRNLIGSFAERLRSGRERAFVGRGPETDAVLDALRGVPGAGPLLVVHGPAGIGKSALLRRLGDLAAAEGARTLLLDGGSDGCRGHLEQVRTDRPLLLLVDDYDRDPLLEPWLCRDVLPRLAADAVVVLAGRRRADPLVWADPGWSQLIRSLPLAELAPAEAAELLARRGLGPGPAEAVLALAGGHPLALRLAADAALAEPGLTAWPPRALTGALLDLLVGELPSPAHRAALQVCAHAPAATEDLLRGVLPGHDSAALFGWLRTRPYLSGGPSGLVPSPAVRALVDDDLRWRAPDGYHRLQEQVAGFFTRRVLAVPEAEVAPVVAGLAFLHRHNLGPEALRPSRSPVREEGYRRSDRADLLAMTERAQGPEAAAVVDGWLGRRPGAFRLRRDQRTGRPLGYRFCLRLEGERTEGEEPAEDPVLAAARAHSRSGRPVRPGEHLRLARFVVDPEVSPDPAADTGTALLLSLAGWLRDERLAWAYLQVPDAAGWASLLGYLDLHPTGPAGGLFAHDWRAVPAQAWLDRGIRMLRSGRVPEPPEPEPAFAVLSRADFDAAVRLALRHPRGSVANPLAGTRLVAGHADPAAALPTVIEEELEAMRRDPGQARLHRVLSVTFASGAATQEAAAQRLHLSFSTYRRHLAAGLEVLSEALWHRELSG